MKLHRYVALCVCIPAWLIALPINSFSVSVGHRYPSFQNNEFRGIPTPKKEGIQVNFITSHDGWNRRVEQNNHLHRRAFPSVRIQNSRLVTKFTDIINRSVAFSMYLVPLLETFQVNLETKNIY